MPSIVTLTDNDVDVLRQGERTAVTAGPLIRGTGWRAGQWVQYATVQVPPVSDFTIEKSAGVYAVGWILYGSENYDDPIRSTYRNYTSYQNKSSFASVASGASVCTLIMGAGQFLFRMYETIALTAGGVRAGGPAVYNVNLPLKVSENGILCQDPDAFLLLATGGTAVIEVGLCSRVPTSSDPRLGLDMKF
jgi:hypothetical protein